jgi:hypothetical protein
MPGLDEFLELASKKQVVKAKAAEVDAAVEQAAPQIPDEQKPGNPFLAGLELGSGAGAITRGKGSAPEMRKEANQGFAGTVGQIAGEVGPALAGGGLGLAAGLALAPATGGLSVAIPIAASAIGGGLGDYLPSMGRRVQDGDSAGDAAVGAVGDAAVTTGTGLVLGTGLKALGSAGKLAKGLMAKMIASSGDDAVKMATKTMGKEAVETMANNGIRTYGNVVTDAHNIGLAEKNIAKQLGEVYELSGGIRVAAEEFTEGWGKAWKHAQPIRKADQKALDSMQKKLFKDVMVSDPAVNGGTPFIPAKALQDAREALKVFVTNNPQAGAAVKQVREQLLQQFYKTLPNKPSAPFRHTFQRLYQSKKELEKLKKYVAGLID